MTAAEPNGADWRIYRGAGEHHGGIGRLPAPPPWRRFDTHDGRRAADVERAVTYRADRRVIDKVNAALMLRRPLLVTGKPGSGKSTLAHSIAYELRLGPVLYWPVSSRTTLQDGLYQYDAVGRLHEASLHRATGGAVSLDIGRYLRLGPLGTALLPGERPRLLLVDELDKSDIDLPNDLLNVIEEGGFTIPELQRLPDEQEAVDVMTADGGPRARVARGQVRCSEFPIVVITSNGERDFPPPFRRRCMPVTIEPPGADQLAEIVRAHLGPDAAAVAADLMGTFLARRLHGVLGTDQFLNAVYLAMSGALPPEATPQDVLDMVLQSLDAPGPE